MQDDVTKVNDIDLLKLNTTTYNLERPEADREDPLWLESSRKSIECSILQQIKKKSSVLFVD